MSKLIGNVCGAAAVAMLLSAGLAMAQTAAPQDQQYLRKAAQDSNFEIMTGKLALEKSSSADVKAYAHMVIHDHEMLKGQIKQADAATQLTATPATSMTSEDQAMYAKLQGLSGSDFDQAYIKELIDGNKKGLDESKSEKTSTQMPAVKTLAEHQVQLDTKHTEKAEQLAQAHHVS